MRPTGVAVVTVVVALSSLSFSACGTVSASVALKKWAASANVVRNDAQLATDARHALTVLHDARSTTGQLRTVCAILDYESLQAYASLPTPDDQTTQLLNTAYTQLGDGANECYAAASSTLKRTRAVSYLLQAGAAFSEAQARMNTLGVMT